MSATTVSLSSFTSSETAIKLPHPYLTEYAIQRSSPPPSSDFDAPVYSLSLKPSSSSRTPPVQLHSPALSFSEPLDLRSSELPSPSNNGPWARARRSPCATVFWTGSEAPTLAQAWLLMYVLFTVRPGMETVRLHLRGSKADLLGEQMRDVLLAIEHPQPVNEAKAPAASNDALVVGLRSTFWQGAASPFGARPVWLPSSSPASLVNSSTPLSSFPLTAHETALTVAPAGDPQDPTRRQQFYHPIRPAKPAPGSTIYSRWIPHLKETFSMVALDYRDDEHLRLFHEWQNDPRVSAGWNETGTVNEHREYLRQIDEDKHQSALLAKWDDTYFAYFEVYWAKEDRLGSFFNPGDFDRGRHSLVGDIRFRGPHRVSAWWSSLMHYLFLDDPRTMNVVGEPKQTNSTVVMYDLIHGFGLEGFVDLPHKRSALVRCSRDRFFQLCPLGENEKMVGGMGIGLSPKL